MWMFLPDNLRIQLEYHSLVDIVDEEETLELEVGPGPVLTFFPSTFIQNVIFKEKKVRI